MKRWIIKILYTMRILIDNTNKINYNKDTKREGKRVNK